MKYTFANHLVSIEDRISPDLLSDANLRSLEAFCSSFPFDAASDFGFETRLGDPEAACDFFLRVVRESSGAAMIGGKSPIASLSAGLLADPVWQRVSELFRIWTDPATLLAERISLFWLEFDFAGNAYNPMPNLFFYLREPENGGPATDWRSMRNLMDEIYLILFGFPFPDDLGETLRYCIERLPEGGRVYQTGFMMPRKTEAVRLVIIGLDRYTILPYLERIGWTGETDKIEEILSDFGPLFDNLVFNLHIGREILPYLGIEMYLGHKKQPQWEPRWGEIFDFLESRSFLRPSKRHGLTDYCGKKTVNHLFPITYINGINHVKMVYKKGLPIEIKGYFGTMIRQLPVK